MKPNVLLICLVASLQVCLMAQPGVSEIRLEGGELSSVEIPDSGVIYRNHNQEFLYLVSVEKSGVVRKVVFQYGKEFDQKNVDMINKSLMNWRFHPYKRDGKNAETSFYLTISLRESTVDGRAWMMVVQNSLKVFDALLPFAEVKDLTDEGRKKLIPEHQEYMHPKPSIKGLLPE